MNIEDIQIINKNGDGILAEGIANIKYTGNNKNYLIYTFNETVVNEKNGNDNVKLYIAQTGDLQKD